MSIKNYIYIGGVVMLASMHLTFAEVSDYSGSLRLKYEYQHLVIQNVDIFVDKKTEKEMKNTIKNYSFCFADDIDESVIEYKNKKFISQNNNLNNIEKLNVLIDNSGEENNTNNNIINKQKIRKYVIKKIVPFLNQEKSDVIISKNEEQKIIFDGYGQAGILVNIDSTVNLIASAIENNISYVNIDVEKIEPIITVNDDELKKLGILELVSVGRSDFTGSSYKRVINITNGASKFNGYLIPNNYTFSFNEQLGDIDGTTGYVSELVILGSKVVPEYGGGLCQVSSTAYRGSMLAGMEIVERHNHSYAISYYAPHGSDATIYSPIKDFKFKNTSGNALLLQTRRGGRNNNELFFHYYGTKPIGRDVKIFGPFTSNYRGALASKITYDSSRPAGSVQVVSHSVAGFTSQFYRTVQQDNKDLYKDIFKSIYQSRGHWIIRGGEDPVVAAKKEEEEKKLALEPSFVE